MFSKGATIKFFQYSGDLIKSGFHWKSFLCKRFQEEGNVQELKEQLEALTAHMDYVQENITDCQTSIMEMEVRQT